jgi:CRP-like cAMP-binding protein
VTTATTPRMADTLPAEHRGRLMSIAREAVVPQGLRLFDGGGRADHFWIVRSGEVALDMRLPGRRPAVIGTLGAGELVGWSWLLPTHEWQVGAATVSPLRAWEFDAEAVRRMCRADSTMQESVTLWVGRVLAQRLHAARTRLVDLYAPTAAESPGERPRPTAVRT